MSPIPTVPLLPVGWEALIPTVGSIITAYIQTQPQNLDPPVPKDPMTAGQAWPSERTWSMLIRIGAACEAAGAAEEDTLAAMGGCIGHSYALEMWTWRANLDLPSTEDTLASPKTFKIPKRGDQQYALLAALVAAVVRQSTPERWNAIWTILGRAAQQGILDVAGVAMRTLSEVRRELNGPIAPPEVVRMFEPMLRAVGRWADADK